MLILLCIFILKKWGGKYRGLSAVLVVAILLLLVFLIKNVIHYFNNRNKETQERVDILNFSSSLEMKKVGRLESYPEVTLLSDIDGEILSLDVTVGDMVDEYQILMQIKNINPISSDYDDVDEMVEVMYENYKELEKEYKEFQNEYGSKIKKLEKQIINDQNALIKSIELKDIEGKNLIEEEIENVTNEYNTLVQQQKDLEHSLQILESDMTLVRNETDRYYYELQKQNPTSPFEGIVGNIYVNEGENVRNGDELITIINNNYIPEISVGLDFEEYLLTKNLIGATILIENENWGNLSYNGKIYTRNQVLNDEGQYTLTLKILDDNVSYLILSDDNSVITVVFDIDSTSQWLPSRCFKKIGNDDGVLTLRDGDVIVDKKVGIKSKRNNWINIDNLGLFGLEKEEEIDGIQLCVRDWDNVLYKDESVVEWRNKFDTLEDFCGEFVKTNPMYWTGHRNAAIVSLLGGPGEVIEVLCDIE